MTLQSERRSMLLVAVLLATVAPASAWAQGATAPTDRFELLGNVGIGQLQHGDSEWGSGLDYGFAVGVRPFVGQLHAVGFEVQAAWLDDAESPSPQVSTDLNAVLVAANVLYHFRSRARVQPYVAGGLSYVSADYTYRCTDCVLQPDPLTGRLVSTGPVEWKDKGSKTGFAFGGGVKIAPQPHLVIRPEILVADTAVGSGFNWNWLQIQVGVGLRF